MEIQVMSSQNYNHSPNHYAHTVATGITSLPNASPEILQLRQSMKDLLTPIFDDAISLEKELLQQDSEQCDKDIGNVGNVFADFALNGFYTIIQMKPQDANWDKEIFNFIATNVKTAIHLERLEFAKNNPGNLAAHNYKSKFGVN